MNAIEALRNPESSPVQTLYVWLIALVIFMFGIWTQPFINFETRFAVFAQEMLRNGPTLFPTTYGIPYPDYPVTSTLLIWLASLPFGEVTKFSAVLPTAIASAVVVALTYRLFAQYSKQWALLAVAFEFMTMTFFAESRSISVDQMVSAVTLTAFFLTHQAYRDRSALPMKWLLVLLVAGFLIRGPIGVVIPTGVVLSHLLLTSTRRELVTFAAAGAGLLIACVVALLGLVVLVYGKDFAIDIVRMQAVSRFAESTPLSKLYYFTSSFGNYALSYPIAVVVTAGILVGKFRKQSSLGGPQATILILLVAWAGIVLLGLSIPQTKKIRYILPMVPALAGLASFVFVCPEPQRWMIWLRRCVVGALLALPWLAIIVLVTQRARLAEYGLAAYPLIGALLLIVIACVVAFYVLEIEKSLAVCSCGFLTVCFFQIAIFEPIDLSLHDTSEFVRHIETLRQKNPGSLVFYKENPDGLAIKYLVNAKMDFSPQFTSDPSMLKSNRLPLWVLTKEANVGDLRAAGIDTETLVHRERFGGTPFRAVFIPAHIAIPVAPMSP